VNEHNLADKLAWSRGIARDTDAETIRSMIPGCVSVEQATVELDRKGIDFIATLRRGATINVDIKARAAGVSRYWRAAPLYGVVAPEPELTIEIWSMMPHNGRPGKAGWTLDESKLTDYVLYLFDATDTHEAFLLPFQLLRMATVRNLDAWRAASPPRHCETNGGPDNGGWRTQSIFIQAWAVIESVAAEMRRRQTCGRAALDNSPTGE